jgi:hypothetical protein
MSLGKQKIEGGQGGKRGHSNMCHWDFTEDIKSKSRKKRRQVDRKFKYNIDVEN